MPQFNFGVGQLALIPSGSNPTPVPVAILMDVSIDISFDLKELRGSYQFPIDVAKGNGKITGKAKHANILGAAIQTALSGATSTTGQVLGVAGEAATIPATPGPYTVTVANSANFSADLGVLNLSQQKYASRVASAPATGQYSVSAGVYTFASADQAQNVAISYSYTSTSGKTTSLSNQLMGQSTPYVLHCYNNYVSKGLGWKFYAVHVPKFTIGAKAEAYSDVDIDFHAVQDSSSLKVVDFFTYE